MGFGEPVEEFAQSLSQVDPHAAKIFVVDKTRSWYERNFKQILSTLHPLAASADDVVLIGASMGGFGALLFAPLLPNVKQVACFAPQFSVAPAIVAGIDRRYLKYARSIKEYAFGHPYVFGRCDAERIVVFGGDAIDAWHLQQHRKFLSPGDTIIEFPDAGHNVSAFLKQQQLLIPILRAIFDSSNVREAIVKANGNDIPVRFLQGLALENVT
jgi:pimeloyl-ACP methyl ester carboxylesterase